jgi:hypothetical protein
VEFGLDSMDWTSFRALQFYVYSSEAFDLQIRIDDWENCIAFDKRFNAVFKLSAGWNKIEIPIEEISRTPSGRPLQTRELKRLLIFRSASQSSSSFLLDDLKLIN